MKLESKPSGHSRRTVCTATLGLFLLSACEAKTMTVTLDVVLFSYLDRPIFDVLVSKRDVGVAGEYPRSGRGTMMGMQFPVGPQKVTWRFADTGETVTAKNAPVLKDLTHNARYLAIHIYSDDTVEFIYTEHFPGLSERGEKFNAEWEKKNHGK